MTRKSVGPLSGRGSQVQWNGDRVELDIPDRITNAGTVGTYSQKEAFASPKRPGSADFLAYPSLIQGVRVFRPC